MINDDAEFEWIDDEGETHFVPIAAAYQLLQWFYKNWDAGTEELEAEIAAMGGSVLHPYAAQPTTKE